MWTVSFDRKWRTNKVFGGSNEVLVSDALSVVFSFVPFSALVDRVDISPKQLAMWGIAFLLDLIAYTSHLSLHALLVCIYIDLKICVFHWWIWVFVVCFGSFVDAWLLCWLLHNPHVNGPRTHEQSAMTRCSNDTGAALAATVTPRHGHVRWERHFSQRPRPRWWGSSMVTGFWSNSVMVRIRIRIRLLGLFQQSGYYGPVSTCKYHIAKKKKTMLKTHRYTHISAQKCKE